MTEQELPKRRLFALVLAVVLGMSPWFSATVVARPLLQSLADGDQASAAWLTIAVQLGFVAGSIISALFQLSDRWSTHRFAAASALAAAAATSALLIPQLTIGSVLALRFFTGAALAGVYPPGIKIAAGWTVGRRGLAIGILVAGTTLASAVPHLLAAVTPENEWRGVLALAALCALSGALLFAFVVTEGPFQAPSAPFRFSAIRDVVRNRGVRLSTAGYLGHMWELYAMWSSVGLFFTWVGQERGLPIWAGPLLAFLTVGAGAIGCVITGEFGDRVGRSTSTIVPMAISASCCVLIGLVASGPLPLLIVVAMIWGTSIVADSAQFSASVTETADRDYVGTAVTLQTAAGFLLTLVTIQLVPWLSNAWGWRFAYMPLALGPLAGIVAMRRMRLLETPRR